MRRETRRLPAKLRWLAVLAIAAIAAIAASAARAADESRPAYRVAVEAPAELKDALERGVGLLRWRSYAGTTPDLLDLLAREAIDEARGIAGAQGFFSARIDVAIDRRGEPPLVTLTVDPGEPTRVASVRVDVTGAAASDVPRGVDAIAAARRSWGLPVGEVFRQSAWTASKNRALAALTSSPYAAARIERSEALIDPGARSADLAVEIASGPPFRFGALEIAGLSKYPESLVRNFSTVRAGDPYEEAELLRFVRRLNASGYFASAQAGIDANPERADAAPVRVAVIEGPTRRLEGGLGYSTDAEFRANASYRDVNFDGRGLQLFAEGRLETKLQSASLRFTRPPNDAGWIGAFSGAALRTDIEGLVTRTASAGTRWSTVEERDERALSATWYLDQQQPAGGEWVESHAVYAEAERYWRRADSLVAPTEGFMASVQAGGGIPGASTRGFGRVVARAAAWLPLGAANELELRAQAGAVLAPTRTGIPSVLLFRTGGDTTVRGYAFDSLGVQEADATVPGRYYAVGNVELTHWVNDAWGVAAFVDAGNATDSLADTHLALGYGVGARVRTPLGPFRVDLAYGQDVHKVRLHFSVGLTF